MRDNMRLKIGFLLAVVASLLLLLPLAMAEGGSEERFQFKFISNGGGAHTISFDNLAVGEVKTLQTDEGEELVVTRTESGIEMDLNGELINIDMPHMVGKGGHGSKWLVSVDGDDVGVAPSSQHSYSWSSDGSGDLMDIGCGGDGNASIHIISSTDGEQQDVDIEISGDSDDADGCHVAIAEAMAGLTIDHSEDGEHEVIVIKRVLHRATDD